MITNYEYSPAGQECRRASQLYCFRHDGAVGGRRDAQPGEEAKTYFFCRRLRRIYKCELLHTSMLLLRGQNQPQLMLSCEKAAGASSMKRNLFVSCPPGPGSSAEDNVPMTYEIRARQTDSQRRPRDDTREMRSRGEMTSVPASVEEYGGSGASRYRSFFTVGLQRRAELTVKIRNLRQHR